MNNNRNTSLKRLIITSLAVITYILVLYIFTWRLSFFFQLKNFQLKILYKIWVQILMKTHRTNEEESKTNKLTDNGIILLVDKKFNTLLVYIILNAVYFCLSKFVFEMHFKFHDNSHLFINMYFCVRVSNFEWKKKKL
jgi:hypothetical protein